MFDNPPNSWLSWSSKIPYLSRPANCNFSNHRRYFFSKRCGNGLLNVSYCDAAVSVSGQSRGCRGRTELFRHHQRAVTLEHWSHLCRRSRSEVKRTYSDTFRPVMSTRMSPVTTLIRGGLPPTPLGQEKPVPCMEQVHRTGSWMERGRTGEDVTGSERERWTDQIMCVCVCVYSV